MTEQDPAAAPEDEPARPADHDVDGVDDDASADPVRTGNVRVDEVIRAVEELEDRPIEEHVGVFESAQAQLRRALDDPGDAEDRADGLTHP